MLGQKFLLSGLLLSVFLILPAMLKEKTPPAWLKAFILLLGSLGILMLVLGMLVYIWE